MADKAKAQETLATKYARHYGFLPQGRHESDELYQEAVCEALLDIGAVLPALEVKMNKTYTGIDMRTIDNWMKTHGARSG